MPSEQCGMILRPHSLVNLGSVLAVRRSGSQSLTKKVIRGAYVFRRPRFEAPITSRKRSLNNREHGQLGLRFHGIVRARVNVGVGGGGEVLYSNFVSMS